MINRLIIKIKNHHLVDENVKLTKKYLKNSQKVVQRLQLTIIQRKEKINQNIRTTTKYIINDYKRAFSDVLIDFFTLTSNDFRVINLIMNDLKLIKDSQANASFDDDFVKSSSDIINKITIVEMNTSMFFKKAMFKSSIAMFVFVTSFRLSKSKIDQFIASFIFLIIVAFTSDRSSFLNLRKSKQIIVYKQFESEFDVEN